MQRQKFAALARHVGLLALMTALCLGTVALPWPYDGGFAALLFVANLLAVHRGRLRQQKALGHVAEGVKEKLNDELGAIIRTVRGRRRERGAERSHTD